MITLTWWQLALICIVFYLSVESLITLALFTRRQRLALRAVQEHFKKQAKKS